MTEFTRHPHLLCMVGLFHGVLFLDPSTLSERFRIPTPGNHSVMTQVVDPDDGLRSRVVVAVAESPLPHDITLYDVFRKTPILSLAGSPGVLAGLTFLSSPDPLIIAGTALGPGGQRGADLRIFHSTTGECVHTHPRFVSRIYRMITIPEWNRPEVFVAGSGTMIRYDVSQREKVGSYTPRTSGFFAFAIDAVAAIPSRRLLVTSGGDSRLRLWSRDGFRCTHTVKLKTCGRSLCTAEEKNLILLGTNEGSVDIWDDRMMSEKVRTVRSDIGSDPARPVDEICRLDDNAFVFVMQDAVAVFNLTDTLIQESLIPAASARVPRDLRGTSSICVLRTPLEGLCEEEEEERISFLITFGRSGDRPRFRIVLQGSEERCLEFWSFLVV